MSTYLHPNSIVIGPITITQTSTGFAFRLLGAPLTATITKPQARRLLRFLSKFTGAVTP